MYKNSFSKHIKEAIQLNQIRKPLYASMSKGKTKWLSNFMITLQYSLLPFAKYFDWKVLKFNKSNIPIMLDDFISMSQIKTYDATVLRKNTVKKKYSFLNICYLTLKELIFIENLEVELSTNFPLVKHVLESIGFIIFNSIHFGNEG